MDQISSLKERSIFSKFKLVWWGLVLIIFSGLLLLILNKARGGEGYGWSFYIVPLFFVVGDFLILFGLLKVFKLGKGLISLLLYDVLHVVVFSMLVKGSEERGVGFIYLGPLLMLLTLVGLIYLIIDSRKQNSSKGAKIFVIVVIVLVLLLIFSLLFG